MVDERDELEADQERALRGWGEGWEPSASLRERTLEAVRSSGAIGAVSSRAHEGRSTRAWVSLAAAAVIVAFLGGLAVGRLGDSEEASTVPAASQQYMFLLFESAEYQNAATAEGQLARVSEYTAWAGEIGRSGRFVTGEKLADDGRWCRMRGEQMEILAPVEDPARGVLAGYFVIGAAGYDDAIQIARDCPHLRYGGTIEVRRIDGT